SWLRCPKCGRASRPPADAVVARRPPPAIEPWEDVLVIRPDVELPAMTPVSVARPPGAATAPGPAAVRGNVLRVVYATALFISVTLLLFAYLEGSVVGSSVFSALALLFFVPLALPPRSGR